MIIREEKKNNEIEKLEIYSNGIKKDFYLKYKFHEKGKKSLILISRENMTNMSGMFHLCSSLTSLNLSNFNTKNVTNMDSMFSGIKKDCNLICKDKKILATFS